MYRASYYTDGCICCMKNATETEIKLRLYDRAAVLDRLPRLGFRVSVPRQFEANTLYDTNDQALRKKEMILRLRAVGDNRVITWKGPGEPGPHKSRPELETSVGSLETFDRIFDKLGLHPVFRYEKYRTEFSSGDAPGVITLDETPIGDFLELEGPGDWIDRTADQLGFSPKDYILESYGRLYLADCERRGVQPAHMVFASH
jgi:adenylate cyclase, class 2